MQTYQLFQSSYVEVHISFVNLEITNLGYREMIGYQYKDLFDRASELEVLHLNFTAAVNMTDQDITPILMSIYKINALRVLSLNLQ